MKRLSKGGGLFYINKLIFCVLIFFATYLNLNSQINQKCVIHFQPVFGSAALTLHHPFVLSTGEGPVQIDLLKFYISGIELSEKSKTVWIEENSFHLMDASEANSLILSMIIPENIQFDHIIFHLGIDSLTNVSGVKGGDLDPTKGMYWAWQSGYINIKLEGNSSVCPGSKHEFQFHLGGYLPQEYSIQEISLEADRESEIVICMDLLKFLQSIDLSRQYQVMIPGLEAIALSGKLRETFSIIK